MKQVTNEQTIAYLISEVAQVVCSKERMEDLTGFDYGNIVKEIQLLAGGQQPSKRAFRNWALNINKPNPYNLNRMSYLVIKRRLENRQIEGAIFSDLQQLVIQVERDKIGDKDFFSFYKKLVKSEILGIEKENLKTSSSNKVSPRYYKRILAFLFFFGSGLLAFYFFSKSLWNNEHIKKFEGNWAGTLVQDSLTYQQLKKNLPSKIHLSLRNNWIGLEGQLTFDDADNGEYKYFVLEGSIIDSEIPNIIKLNYHCTPNCIPKGTIILEIEGLSKKMVGGLLGYGAKNETVVRGEITLVKELPANKNRTNRK